MEARSAADCGNTNPIGTFLLATNERDLQLLSCMAAGVSSVAADIADTVTTHRSKVRKTDVTAVHGHDYAVTPSVNESSGTLC